MPQYGVETYVEWYPVHLLDSNSKEETIELSEEEYKDYCEVLDRFNKWQKRIANNLKIPEMRYYT
jgi:hypothetical protein